MPVPIPAEPSTAPPDHAEVVLGARAKVTAVREAGGLTPIQRAVIHAHIRALTGVEVDLDRLDPLTATEVQRAGYAISTTTRRATTIAHACWAGVLRLGISATYGLAVFTKL